MMKGEGGMNREAEAGSGEPASRESGTPRKVYLKVRFTGGEIVTAPTKVNGGLGEVTFRLPREYGVSGALRGSCYEYDDKGRWFLNTNKHYDVFNSFQEMLRTLEAQGYQVIIQGTKEVDKQVAEYREIANSLCGVKKF